MITGTPSDFDINGPTNRGIVSAVLPGGYGTTIVIVVSGKPAAAGSGTPRYTGDKTAAKINVVHFISKSLPGIPNTRNRDVGSSKFTGVPVEAVLIRPTGRLPSILFKRELVITSNLARQRAARRPDRASRALRSCAKALAPFPDPRRPRGCRRGNARDQLRPLLPDSSCCEWCRLEWPAW